MFIMLMILRCHAIIASQRLFIITLRYAIDTLDVSDDSLLISMP